MRATPYGGKSDALQHRCCAVAIIAADFAILFAIGILLTGCATTPQQTVVSHVQTLPPVNIAVPVLCVKKMPDRPTASIDPNATPLQRYYQMRAAIDDLDRYYIEANAALLACSQAVIPQQEVKP